MRFLVLKPNLNVIFRFVRMGFWLDFFLIITFSFSLFLLAIPSNVFAKKSPQVKQISFYWGSSLSNQFPKNAPPGFETPSNPLFQMRFSRRMKERFETTVLKSADKVFSPFTLPESRDLEAYQNNRSRLARWVSVEYLRGEVLGVLNGGDQDSSVLKVANALNEMNAGVEWKNVQSETEPRGFKPKASTALEFPMRRQQDETVSTSLRTKINIINARGSVRFTSSIVSSEVDMKFGEREKVWLNLYRDFKKIDVYSSISYTLQENLLSFRLIKRFTAELSLDFFSERFSTRSNLLGVNSSSRETARFSYVRNF